MNPLESRLTEILDRSKRDNRYRTLEAITSPQGSEISIGGARCLNFSSNDYLGLSNHPVVRAAAAATASSHGVGSGASALLSGRSSVHAELERAIAQFLRRDAALLYSSGYLANLGVIGTLVHRDDHVFQDELNHASLIDAVRLSQAATTRYPHVDVTALGNALELHPGQRKWIVTDTLFSMDGDLAPLPDLAALASEHEAVLIGDDAHGFGVLAHGRGSAAAAGLDQDTLPVQIITFGKALGTAGAAVVGSTALIEALVQRSRTFIYDTAPPPMIAAATLASLELVASAPEIHARLTDNIRYFRETASTLPLLPSATPIQPVLLGDEARALAVAARLRERGLYVRAIRPPTVPAGTSRLRICISAAHTRADIDVLTGALSEVLGELTQ